MSRDSSCLLLDRHGPYTVGGMKSPVEMEFLVFEF